MATGYAKVPELTFPNDHPSVPQSRWGVPNATKTLSAMRILFGAIFVFDGALKWILLQQGTLQSVVQGSVLGAANPLYGSSFVANNWLFFGVLIGTCETLAGLALVAGLFQRPAAIGAAGIMGFIWAYGGFGGFGQAGYTDPGGGPHARARVRLARLRPGRLRARVPLPPPGALGGVLIPSEDAPLPGGVNPFRARVAPCDPGPTFFCRFPAPGGGGAGPLLLRGRSRRSERVSTA
jgi:uncharacterized membrane protein YphA (DoxX/SURF4 family)